MVRRREAQFEDDPGHGQGHRGGPIAVGAGEAEGHAEDERAERAPGT